MHFFIEGSYENSTNYKISAFASKKYVPNEISVCDTHMAQNLRKPPMSYEWRHGYVW